MRENKDAECGNVESVSIFGRKQLRWKIRVFWLPLCVATVTWESYSQATELCH